MRTAYRLNRLISTYELTHIQETETEPIPDEKKLLIIQLKEQTALKRQTTSDFFRYRQQSEQMRKSNTTTKIELHIKIKTLHYIDESNTKWLIDTGSGLNYVATKIVPLTITKLYEKFTVTPTDQK